MHGNRGRYPAIDNDFFGTTMSKYEGRYTIIHNGIIMVQHINRRWYIIIDHIFIGAHLYMDFM